MVPFPYPNLTLKARDPLPHPHEFKLASYVTDLHTTIVLAVYWSVVNVFKKASNIKYGSRFFVASLKFINRVLTAVAVLAS